MMPYKVTVSANDGRLYYVAKLPTGKPMSTLMRWDDAKKACDDLTETWRRHAWEQGS